MLRASEVPLNCGGAFRLYILEVSIESMAEVSKEKYSVENNLGMCINTQDCERSLSGPGHCREKF